MEWRRQKRVDISKTKKVWPEGEKKNFPFFLNRWRFFAAKIVTWIAATAATSDFASFEQKSKKFESETLSSAIKYIFFYFRIIELRMARK